MALQILTTIILPVFILIGVGVLADRFLPVDLGTISRLSFYVFISAVVFIKLYESSLDPARFGLVLGFNIAHLLIMLLISWYVFKLKAFRDQHAVLVMDAIFYNTGNFGIPFAQLAFGDLGVNVMTIILMVQLIANFTLGLWLVGVGRGRWQDLAKGIVKAPVLYMILVALALNSLHIVIPKPISQSIHYLADGLIPIALLTLGVQLSRSRALIKGWALPAASFARLIFSPLVAAVMVSAAVAVGIANPEQWAALGPILIASAGLPVAVNVYILGMEYGQDPELASQSIFWTTLLSAFTLTMCLALLGIH